MKDLERRSIFWIIHMNPTCNYYQKQRALWGRHPERRWWEDKPEGCNTSQEKPTAARTWKRQCVNHSVMSLSQSPWTIAHQALLSMEFSRQEYWSWLPLSSRVSAKTVTQLTPWFRTCDHKKCERIDSCSFKPPNMWPFVRPASGNKYK